MNLEAHEVRETSKGSFLPVTKNRSFPFTCRHHINCEVHVVK